MNQKKANQRREETSSDRCSELYYRYERLMFKIAYSLTKDELYAEDCVQDAFLYIAENTDKIDDVTSSRTRNYVCMIVKYIAIKRYQEEKRTIPVGNIPEDGDTFPAAEEIYIRYRDIITLVKEINTLENTYRIPLILKTLLGLKSKEIADILDISDGNVRKRIYEAKKMVRSRLEPEMIIDE